LQYSCIVRIKACFLRSERKKTVIEVNTSQNLLIEAHRVLRRSLAARAAAPSPMTIVARQTDAERSRRSLQRCHYYSLYERPRFAPPKDSGAYVPEMAARIDDDRNLTDGARRCARKLAEYTYRHDREGRAAEITVTYLMRALGRCRRSIQRYLRLLEREGYIRVDVVHGHRTRMCTGLVVQLLAPLFPRHHADRWPAKLGIPGATKESQKKRFIDSTGAGLVRIPVQSWALRCMDGVFRSLMKTLPPPDRRLTLAA
jgi:hypothetical protein